MTHICVSKITIIGSDNGLSPRWRQAIIWTNAGILLIGPLGTNFSEIYIEILTFSFKKMCLKVSSVKWRPFCLGLNVLTLYSDPIPSHKVTLGKFKWGDLPVINFLIQDFELKIYDKLNQLGKGPVYFSKITIKMQIFSLGILKSCLSQGDPFNTFLSGNIC